jgi:hypothetical protein
VVPCGLVSIYMRALRRSILPPSSGLCTTTSRTRTSSWTSLQTSGAVTSHPSRRRRLRLEEARHPAGPGTRNRRHRAKPVPPLRHPGHHISAATANTASITRGHDRNRPDDGGSKHLRNVGKLLLDYTAQHPRRQVIFIVAAVRI